MADLFFADQISIPGTSFLCNPATFKLLREDTDFLLGLLSDGRIAPILPRETGSFAVLADRLVELGPSSSAIVTSGQEASAVQEAARLLDEYLVDKDIVTVSSAELDRAKTEVSQTLVRELRSIVHVTEKHHRRIVALASKELDEKGAIPGSWWFYLAKTLLPELRPFDRQLSELGVIVFDLSYTYVADSPLVGHSYNHDVEEFCRLAQPFTANVRLEVSPGIFQPRDLESSVLDGELLAQVGIDGFRHVVGATQVQRDRYSSALSKFRRDGSEDDLLEAKERLDEYLVALSRQLRSRELSRFADQVRSVRKIKSQIMALQSGNVVLYSFAVAGGWNEVVKQSLAHTTYGLLILAGLGTVGTFAADRLRRVKQEKEARLERQQDQLKRTRPASIYVPVQASSH
jgi:hypothetical protein